MIPLVMNKKRIKQADAIILLKQKAGMRKQITGLVFGIDQAPTQEKSRGWPIVLRKPSRKKREKGSAFRIKNNCFGNILVHYIHQDVEDQIMTSTNWYLSSHSIVRNNQGEKGTMVPIGKRIDVRSSTISYYKATRATNSDLDEKKILLSTAISFSNLLQRSICASLLNEELKKLKTNTILAYDTSSKTNRHCLPTMAASEDLTNSIHCDVSDGSSSFAVFFRKRQMEGVMYLLFPAVGCAVQITGTTIVSWKGYVQPHCSVTISPGILSLFGSSNKYVSTRLLVENKFQQKQSKISINDVVYVRERLINMKTNDVLNMQDYRNQIYMNRFATVLSIEQNIVWVMFLGKLRYLGKQKFRRNNVIKYNIRK